MLKHVFVLFELNLSPSFEPFPLHFELPCFQGAGVEASCCIEQHKNHLSQPHTATQRTPEPKVCKRRWTPFDSHSCPRSVVFPMFPGGR